MEEVRYCIKCLQTKLLSEFAKKKKHKNGEQLYASMCKICGTLYAQINYRKKRDGTSKRDRPGKSNLAAQYYRDIRDNKPCTDCKIPYPYYVMDFDHLANKEYNVSHLAREGQLDLLKEELKKCQLVCSNCHRKRTHDRAMNSIVNNGTQEIIEKLEPEYRKRLETGYHLGEESLMATRAHLRPQNSRGTPVTVEEVREIRNLHITGLSYSKIAKKFGLTKTCVGSIVRRDRYAWVI